MGRDQTPLAIRASVRAWAEATCAASGLKPKQLAAYFRSKDGAPSTTFYSCFRYGRPLPQLQLGSGALGPALNIEADHPGTLKWLLHPMWQAAVKSPDLTVADVRRRAAVLQPEVRKILFDGPSDRLHRGVAVSSGLCSRLAGIGDLDALAAIFYLGLEACVLGDPCGILIARKAIERHTESWACLQSISTSTRRWIETVFVRAIDSFDVVDGPIDASVASVCVAAETLSEYLPRSSTGTLMISPDAYEWLAGRISAKEVKTEQV